MPVPVELASRIDDAIACAQRLLIPADITLLSQKLDATLALFERQQPQEWQHTGEFYLEALEDVPADLVDVALKHVRMNLKWFPKPSELREPINGELAKRRLTLNRLKTAKLRADQAAAEPHYEGGRSLTPEQQAQVDAMKAARAKPMPYAEQSVPDRLPRDQIRRPPVDQEAVDRYMRDVMGIAS